MVSRLPIGILTSLSLPILAFALVSWSILASSLVTTGKTGAWCLRESTGSARRELDYPRYLFGVALSLGRIYSDHFYFDGMQLTSSAILIRELPGNRFDKWRLQFAARGFVVAYNVNLCARLQYMTSSSDERVSPYALSGSYNVRGYRDKYDAVTISSG